LWRHFACAAPLIVKDDPLAGHRLIGLIDPVHEQHPRFLGLPDRVNEHAKNFHQS